MAPRCAECGVLSARGPGAVRVITLQRCDHSVECTTHWCDQPACVSRRQDRDAHAARCPVRERCRWVHCESGGDPVVECAWCRDLYCSHACVDAHAAACTMQQRDSYQYPLTPHEPRVVARDYRLYTSAADLERFGVWRFLLLTLGWADRDFYTAPPESTRAERLYLPHYNLDRMLRSRSVGDECGFGIGAIVADSGLQGVLLTAVPILRRREDDRVFLSTSCADEPCEVFTVLPGGRVNVPAGAEPWLVKPCVNMYLLPHVRPDDARTCLAGMKMWKRPRVRVHMMDAQPVDPPVWAIVFCTRCGLRETDVMYGPAWIGNCVSGCAGCLQAEEIFQHNLHLFDDEEPAEQEPPVGGHGE